MPNKFKQINYRVITLFSVFSYIIAFFLFYPPFFSSIDENSFLRVSYLIRTGSFVINNFFYKYSFVPHVRGYVSNYSIGQSLLLLPSTFLGWKSVFLSGLLIHLAGTFIFYKILKRQGEETYNVLLFLLFPYFIYFSTTLYRDFSSALFITGAFYFYISKGKKNHFLSGVFFGAACLIRYTNLVAFLPFVLVSLFTNRSRLKYLVSGFVPFAIVILVYNQVFYGGLFRTTYTSLQGVTYLPTYSLANYLVYIPFFSYRLLIIYPLMFFAPFFYKKEAKFEIWLTILFYFSFFGIFPQSGYGYGLQPSTLTRYFLPIIPLYLVTYVPFYKKLLEKVHLPHDLVFSLALIVLFIGMIFILSGQHKFLSQQYSVSSDIYSYTTDHSLVIAKYDTSRYIMEPFGDRRFLDIGTNNLSHFFDDKTYIINKHYNEGFRSSSEIEEDINIEGLIENFETELVYTSDYAVDSSYITIRPFTLDIYKIK